MEEKERYINQVFGLKGHYKEYVFDTYLSDKIEFNECYKVLNQQDKRIKELQETNKILSNELTKNSILKQDHIETCCGIPIFEIPKMKEENQQLKQQLHDLPKKIVEEIGDCLLDVSNGWWRYFMTDDCEYMLSSDLQGCLNETIDTILKKYGGENDLR